MRIDYDRLIGEVRVDLDQPDPHSPTDDLIMQKAGDEAQLLMNEMGNAPPAWSQRYLDLSVSINQSQYLLSAEHAFGKPVRVHTIDPTDRYHVTRKINLCDRQNIDEFYRGQQTAVYGKHTAEVMVFWEEPGAHMVEVLPTPAMSCQYRIWYNLGAIDDPRRATDAPVPPEYWRYLRIKTSLSALPYCEWTERDAMARVKILGESLLKKELEYKEQWRQFILTNRVLGNTEPLGYADYYMESGF